MIAGALADLASLWGSLQRAAGATDRLFAVVDTVPEIRDPAAPTPLPAGRGAIRFEGVDVRVPGAARPAGADRRRPRGPRRARSSRWSVRRARASRPCSRCSTGSTTSTPAACCSRASTSARCRWPSCAARSRWSRRSRCCSRARSATTSPTAATASPRDEVDPGGARRARPRLHRRLPGRLRDGHRRARHEAVGRAEAAHRARPRPGREPARADPRRGDLEPRRRERGRRAERARPHHGGPHDDRSSPTA